VPYDLVAVGDVMLDGALPALLVGGRVHGRIELRPGGSATNAALAAAHLGARAAVVGRVGADAAGRLVADALTAAGVEPFLARDEQVPTGCVVVVGGTSIVADPGASARLAPGDLPETLEADAVLVSGYSLLQPGPEAAARTAFERARTDLLAVDAASARLLEAFGVDRFLEATAAATVLLVLVLGMTTAAGSPDDLGRAGRTLARQCSALVGTAVGPWPGSFYTAPLATVVLAGLVLAGWRCAARQPNPWWPASGCWWPSPWPG